MQPAAREVEDVRNLWHVHAVTADRDRITHVLTMLEEALAQGDLVPAFEAIAGRRRS
jgi:hypothetical protein